MTEKETKPRNNWHRPIAGPQQPGASHLGSFPSSTYWFYIL